jgi:ubiquinone/menaquinone biosynthesis C-methylase UbiE
MVSTSATFTGPQHYNDCLGPLYFDHYAADLVQRLPKHLQGNVLEIACGTGLVTKRLREHLAPSSRLVATDLSKIMLDYARNKLVELNGIDWEEADALKLPFEAGSFGAVVCGFGIMFTPDRRAALRETRRVLIEGGILLFSVWDAIEENTHALSNAKVIEDIFPNDAEMRFRMPYDMGDPALLRQLLSNSGFRDTRIETKRINIEGADPRSIATGMIRGTPRSALIEKRGISLDLVIEKIASDLRDTGGDPYRGQTQAVIVEARAI